MTDPLPVFEQYRRLLRMSARDDGTPRPQVIASLLEKEAEAMNHPDLSIAERAIIRREIEDLLDRLNPKPFPSFYRIRRGVRRIWMQR